MGNSSSSSHTGSPSPRSCRVMVRERSPASRARRMLWQVARGVWRPMKNDAGRPSNSSRSHPSMAIREGLHAMPTCVLPLRFERSAPKCVDSSALRSTCPGKDWNMRSGTPAMPPAPLYPASCAIGYNMPQHSAWVQLPLEGRGLTLSAQAGELEEAHAACAGHPPVDRAHQPFGPYRGKQ